MTATQTDLEILTCLDFDPGHAEPCEHSDHDKTHVADDPASWRVMYLCPGCGRARLYLLCNSGKDLLSGAGVVYCPECKHHDTWGAFVILLERI